MNMKYKNQSYFLDIISSHIIFLSFKSSLEFKSWLHPILVFFFLAPLSSLILGLEVLPKNVQVTTQFLDTFSEERGNENECIPFLFWDFFSWCVQTSRFLQHLVLPCTFHSPILSWTQMDKVAFQIPIITSSGGLGKKMLKLYGMVTKTSIQKPFTKSPKERKKSILVLWWAFYFQQPKFKTQKHLTFLILLFRSVDQQHACLLVSPSLHNCNIIFFFF